MAAIGLVVMHGLGVLPSGLGWVFSVVIVVAYLVIVRLTFKYERAHPDERDEVNEAPYRGKNGGLYARFAVASVVIVGTGLWLAKIGAALATVEVQVGAGTFRLGESFVGTLFLAASTSMPELVVTVAAFRMGAANMALGNLFGSNVFNVAIIAVCDVVSGGRLFELGSLSNLIPLSLSVVMTGVAILGLAYRPRKTPGRFGLDSAALVVVYVLGMIVLFCSGSVGH